jgi:glutathione S-transferase
LTFRIPSIGPPEWTGLPNLVGNEFAAGDIPISIVIYRWLLLDIERPHLPNVEAWNQRLQQRPAFQASVSPPQETITPLKIS